MFCILLCFYLWIYGMLNKISYHIMILKKQIYKILLFQMREENHSCSSTVGMDHHDIQYSIFRETAMDSATTGKLLATTRVSTITCAAVLVVQ
jgi:hypothetical protein